MYPSSKVYYFKNVSFEIRNCTDFEREDYKEKILYALPKYLMLVMVHKHTTCPIPILSSSPFREEKCKNAQTRLIYEWFLLDSRHQSKKKKTTTKKETFENLEEKNVLSFLLSLYSQHAHLTT